MEIISAQAISEQLRLKVKSTIFEAIPDEEWDKLIKAEIALFFESRPASNGWGNRIPSQFGEVVSREMSVILRERLQQTFASNEWKVSYDGIVGDKLREAISREAPNIIAAWVGSMITNAIQMGQFR